MLQKRYTSRKSHLYKNFMNTLEKEHLENQSESTLQRKFNSERYLKNTLQKRVQIKGFKPSILQRKT
jgi:hypothetical protein